MLEGKIMSRHNKFIHLTICAGVLHDFYLADVASGAMALHFGGTSSPCPSVVHPKKGRCGRRSDLYHRPLCMHLFLLELCCQREDLAVQQRRWGNSFGAV